MSHEEFLSTVPLFSNCTPAEIAAIAAVAQEHAFAAGQIIVTQGTPGQAFYMVLSGRVEIMRDDELAGHVRPGGLLRGDVPARPGAALGDDPRGRRADRVPDAVELGLQVAAREAPVDRHQAARGPEPPAAGRRRAAHAADRPESDTARGRLHEDVRAEAAAGRRGPDLRALPAPRWRDRRHARDEADDPRQRSPASTSSTRRAGNAIKVKIKPDTYFGTDPRKIADQEPRLLPQPGERYAFETISHHVTREPGLDVQLDGRRAVLLLHRARADRGRGRRADGGARRGLLLGARGRARRAPRPADGSRCATGSRTNYEHYMPRPVTLGDHSGWYRIIPIADIDPSVATIDVRGASSRRGPLSGRSGSPARRAAAYLAAPGLVGGRVWTRPVPLPSLTPLGACSSIHSPFRRVAT